VFREGWKTGIGFQPFVLSRSAGETPRKRVFQPPWNHRQADLQKLQETPWFGQRAMRCRPPWLVVANHQVCLSTWCIHSRQSPEL